MIDDDFILIAYLLKLLYSAQRTRLVFFKLEKNVCFLASVGDLLNVAFMLFVFSYCCCFQF